MLALASGAPAATTGRSFSRPDEWAIGWRAFTKAPILGHGPEGASGGLRAGRDGRPHQRLYGSQVYTDRAHMGLLDLAILAAASPCLFLVGVWIVGRAVFLRRDRLTGTQVGLMAALVSPRGAGPVPRRQPRTAGMALRRTTAGWGEQPANRCAPSRHGSRDRLRWCVPGCGRRWHGAEHRLANEASTNLTDYVVRDAVALRPDSIRIRYAAAQLCVATNPSSTLDAALEQLESAQRWSPLDPAVNQLYVELLTLRATRSGIASDGEAAWIAAQALVANRPLDERALRMASTAAGLAGDAASASKLSDAADAVTKDFPED
ncbi:MAG: hypothetical protein R2706_00495 [Acidimicrobiales bacterium]